MLIQVYAYLVEGMWMFGYLKEYGYGFTMPIALYCVLFIKMFDFIPRITQRVISIKYNIFICL